MKDIKKIVLSGMFLAMGIVLPFVTGNIPQIGSMLCPMHIPVLLCGLICGPICGASVMFGMPPMFPGAAAMAFELMTYGFLAGFLYEHSKWQCVRALYRCLVLAMIGGRLVWGVAMIVLLGISGGSFTFQAFLAGALLNAIPGIALQLVLIPVIMVSLHKTGIKRFVTTPVNV